MMKIFARCQSNKLYEKVLTCSKHKDLRMHVPSVAQNGSELNAWRGARDKTEWFDVALHWRSQTCLVASGYAPPLTPTLVQLALIFLELPWMSHFLEHLYLKLTRQSQAETSAGTVLGVDWHHHLRPSQLLMSADGPSLCTRNSPSIWPRWGQGVLPGSCSHTPRNNFLESMLLSSCLCPILGLLVQVNRNVFSLMLHF